MYIQKGWDFNYNATKPSCLFQPPQQILPWWSKPMKYWAQPSQFKETGTYSKPESIRTQNSCSYEERVKRYSNVLPGGKIWCISSSLHAFKGQRTIWFAYLNLEPIQSTKVSMIAQSSAFQPWQLLRWVGPASWLGNSVLEVHTSQSYQDWETPA